jgi:hypothetical protein
MTKSFSYERWTLNLNEAVNSQRNMNKGIIDQILIPLPETGNFHAVDLEQPSKVVYLRLLEKATPNTCDPVT